MPLVELEPTIPLFERTKTVHALDRVATMISTFIYMYTPSNNLGVVLSSSLSLMLTLFPFNLILLWVNFRIYNIWHQMMIDE
jgi:hypothetical protein